MDAEVVDARAGQTGLRGEHRDLRRHHLLEAGRLLHDAPGALGPHVPLLQRAMWEAVRSTDLALVVVDAADQRPLRALSRFLSQLGEVLDSQEADGERRTETVLVLNKVDKVRPKARLLPLSEQLHEWHRCATPAEPRPGVR